MVEKIVYKVVVVALAIAAIPIAIFSPMFRIVGDVSIGKTYVGEDVSLYDIYDLFLAKDSTFSGFGDFHLTDPVRQTLPALIAAGVLLVLAILIGFAAAGVAVGSKKKLPVLLLSVGALLCVFGMFIAFNRFFAAPYLDGTISVGNLGFIEEGILETIFSALISIEVLQISSAGFLLAGVYGGMMMWLLAFILVETGEKPKAAAHK